MTPCIETTHAKDGCGYGTLKREGVTTRHHRWVYCQVNKLSLADIAGKVIMHTCDNPSCVNIDHLKLGSHQDNATDKKLKGRHTNGKQATVSPERAAEIRANFLNSGHTQETYAKSLGMSTMMCHNILRRKGAYK